MAACQRTLLAVEPEGAPRPAAEAARARNGPWPPATGSLRGSSTGHWQRLGEREQPQGEPGFNGATATFPIRPNHDNQPRTVNPARPARFLALLSRPRPRSRPVALSLSRTRALSPSLSLAGESLKFRETNLNGIECHQKRRARTNHAHANLGSSTKNAVAEASAILTSPAARRATRAATPRRTVRPRDGSSSPLVTSIGTTPCFARAIQSLPWA